jgi:UDP-N-acetylmuramoyl-L-alanyl-D-glutamate--2,6-diaminopimelate ligase
MSIPQHIFEYIRHNKRVARHHMDITNASVYILASTNVSTSDALKYVNNAIDKKAKYVILDEKIYQQIIYLVEPSQTEIYQVKNSKLIWAIAASYIYHNIPQYINAVTGTSGKTSVAYIYAQISSIIKEKSGYIGTLGVIEMLSTNYNNINIEKLDDTLTTPDAMDLRRFLSLFYDKKCQYVCIEASSHGIEQHRIDTIPFTAAAFTNLSPEHLDYHTNMDEYYNAKARLFTELLANGSFVIINIDDEHGRKLINDINKLNKKFHIITYGKNISATIKLIDFKPGQSFDIEYNHQKITIKSSILGEYNIYNILCAYGLLIANEFSIDEIINATPHIVLPIGRMTKLQNHKNTPDIYIDYAHKPEALRSVLKALCEYKNKNYKKNLWVVFGCGGDRDKVKRPLMGKIAAEFADIVIVTDDNPRYENPSTIRRQIISGINNNNKYIEINDRKKAIEHVIQNMLVDDILLIAGKGHEKYQIIQDERIECCDIDIATTAIAKFL